MKNFCEFFFPDARFKGGEEEDTVYIIKILAKIIILGRALPGRRSIKLFMRS